ncbi:hypothetical protein D3C83_207370 [compost metagenome]
MVDALAVCAVGAGQLVHGRLRDQIDRGEALELTYDIGIGHQLRVTRRAIERPVLGEELDVGDSAPVLLQIEGAVRGS